MFACVVAGRAVQTDFAQVAEFRYTLDISDAAKVQHLCVFLTQPLPQGAAAGLHVAWGPDYAKWDALGVLANEKPSAVYRISPPSDSNLAFGDDSVQSIRLGISLEPVDSVSLQHAQQQAEKNIRRMESANVNAVKMLKHLYNYVGSFSADGRSVPLKAFEKWYQTFLSKIQHDPLFFRKANT